MLVDFQDLVSIVENIDIELICEKIYQEKGEDPYNENELLDIEINKIIMQKYGIGIDVYLFTKKLLINQLFKFKKEV